MLRTAFPINVVTDKVECDIQFGSLKRSTTENTSWEYAQFEICAQKWVDVSQGDYGAAVLNNGKYGYRVKDTTIDINLLRSPCYPDTNADYGKHAFTYALYPHKGGRVEAKVSEYAYALNMPLTVAKVGSDAWYTNADEKVTFYFLNENSNLSPPSSLLLTAMVPPWN